MLDADPICPFNASYGDNYLYCSYQPILDVPLLAQLLAIEYFNKGKPGEARRILQIANTENLQKFDLHEGIPRAELTKDGYEFINELGLAQRKGKDCPEEFHHLYGDHGDLFLLGVNAAKEYYGMVRDIAQGTAFDSSGNSVPIPMFSEAMDHLQAKMKSISCLDVEEEKLVALRNRLISAKTLKEKSTIFEEEKEVFKRMSAYLGFLRILHCQDGIRRDTNTTMASGKRAALVHTLITDPEAFVMKDGDWHYSCDQARQLSNTLGTIFGCGFLGEITCLKSNTVISRSNSFASGVGIVQEIHAVDASAFFRRSVEATSCSAELNGFDGDFDSSERLPKNASDTVKQLQWPNMYRSHRASFVKDLLDKRGIPTSDSRGKGYNRMGINSVQVVMCTKHTVNGLSLQQVPRDFPMHNLIFLGCRIMPLNVLTENQSFRHTEPVWADVEPMILKLTKSRAVLASLFEKKRLDTPKVVQASDFTAKKRSLETTGTIFDADLMSAINLLWFAKLADAPPETREALVKSQDIDGTVFEEGGPAGLIARAACDLRHLENVFLTQPIDASQFEKFLKINCIDVAFDGELPKIAQQICTGLSTFPGLGLRPETAPNILPYSVHDVRIFLEACDARECSYPSAWTEIIGGRPPDAEEVRVLTYYMSQFAAQPDRFERRHLVKILPTTVDEATIASERNEIEMERRLIASSTMKSSAIIAKDDIAKIIAAASKGAVDSLSKLSSAEITSETGPEIAKRFSKLKTFTNLLAPNTKHMVVSSANPDSASSRAMAVKEERLENDIIDAVVDVASVANLNDEDSAKWAEAALSDVMDEQVSEFGNSVKDATKELMKERLENARRDAKKRKAIAQALHESRAIIDLVPENAEVTGDLIFPELPSKEAEKKDNVVFDSQMQPPKRMTEIRYKDISGKKARTTDAHQTKSQFPDIDITLDEIADMQFGKSSRSHKNRAQSSLELLPDQIDTAEDALNKELRAESQKKKKEIGRKNAPFQGKSKKARWKRNKRLADQGGSTHGAGAKPTTAYSTSQVAKRPGFGKRQKTRGAYQVTDATDEVPADGGLGFVDDSKTAGETTSIYDFFSELP